MGMTTKQKQIIDLLSMEDDAFFEYLADKHRCWQTPLSGVPWTIDMIAATIAPLDWGGYYLKKDGTEPSENRNKINRVSLYRTLKIMVDKGLLVNGIVNVRIYSLKSDQQNYEIYKDVTTWHTKEFMERDFKASALAYTISRLVKTVKDAFNADESCVPTEFVESVGEPGDRFSFKYVKSSYFVPSVKEMYNEL